MRPPAIACAESLRRQSARPHAQEAEKPIEHIEHRSADGYGGYEHRTTHVAGNGHIGQRKQRCGDIDNNRRQRDSGDCFKLSAVEYHIYVGF